MIVSNKIGLCKALVSSETITAARIPNVNGYKHKEILKSSIYGMSLIIHYLALSEVKYMQNLTEYQLAVNMIK